MSKWKNVCHWELEPGSHGVVFQEAKLSPSEAQSVLQSRGVGQEPELVFQGSGQGDLRTKSRFFRYFCVPEEERSAVKQSWPASCHPAMATSRTG